MGRAFDFAVTMIQRCILLGATLALLTLPVLAQAPAAPAPEVQSSPTTTPDQTAALQQMQSQLLDMSAKYTSLKNDLDRQKKDISVTKDTLDKTIQQTSTLDKDLATTKESTEKKYTEVADSTSLSINISWTLITGYLVMFMQAGFALVETGFTRAKNAAHTMMMNFMVYTIAMLGYWVCGFAFQFGGTGADGHKGADGIAVSDLSVSTVGSLGPNVGSVLSSELGFHVGDMKFGLLGNSGYFLAGSSFDAGIFTLFLFQMVFMDTAATIPTGAMAERWRFIAFSVFSFFVGALIYPVFGNWVWGGGWLAAMGVNFGLGHGHVDFAGSSVVHMVGGVMALVGAKFIGPRIGKYNEDGTPNPIPGHNLPMAMVGTFILAFGWFGFNPGSTLSAMDTQIGIIATNTMLASASGAVATMIIAWLRLGKPDPSLCCNGMLAGLVAITAPCAFVDAWAAVTLGAIAGLIMYLSVFFVEEKLKIDDPVGAISVHGACGAWGVLSLGIFANGKYGDGWNGVTGKVEGIVCYINGTDTSFMKTFGQFFAEAIGATTNLLFVGSITFVILYGIEKVLGNRVSAEIEMEGLDGPEMGALGYSNHA